MKGNYPDDTFTKEDVINCLRSQDLKYKVGSRYILTQCPLHEDSSPSAQVYLDDFFVKCHAGCEGGRFHITKAFPELRPSRLNGQKAYVRLNKKESFMSETKYKTVDLMDKWKEMAMIPRDHYFKGIPTHELDDLGWRWDEPSQSYFIPYFSASKDSIPFGQWRHLKGDRRFTFLKDLKPTCYGTWNLKYPKLFVVEGTSDAAVLQHCAVPWIALPSASSGGLMKALAAHCKATGIELVYAGDNDLPGDKLRQALDEVMPYRVCQPPYKYKDWGDFFEAEAVEGVLAHCNRELIPQFIQEYPSTPEEAEAVSHETLTADDVKELFPGATELQKKNIDPVTTSKEQAVKESTVLF